MVLPCPLLAPTAGPRESAPGLSRLWAPLQPPEHAAFTRPGLTFLLRTAPLALGTASHTRLIASLRSHRAKSGQPQGAARPQPLPPMSPPQYPFPQGPVTHRPLSAGRAGTDLNPLGESEATRRRAPSPGPGSSSARGIGPAPQRGCSHSYTRALRKGAKGCGLSAERGEGLGRACHPESPQTILSSWGRDTGGAPLAWQRLERVSGFAKPIDRCTGLPGTACAAAVQTPPHSLAAATQQHWWGAPWDLLWAQSGLAA